MGPDKPVAAFLVTTLMGYQHAGSGGGGPYVNIPVA